MSTAPTSRCGSVRAVRTWQCATLVPGHCADSVWPLVPLSVALCNTCTGSLCPFSLAAWKRRRSLRFQATGYRPATSWVHYTTSCNTQSSAPEDGQNNCLKHVELIGIINEPLLLHLVGCLYYLYRNLLTPFSKV